MSYITKQDLVDELGEEKLLQLVDNSGTADLNAPAVNARIQQVIDDAVGTFDAYARTRYTLPVPLTAKVKSTCLKIAVFSLYEGRSTADEGIYKVKENAYRHALRFLEAVQAGKAALDVPAAQESESNPASPDEVLKGGSRPSPFAEDNLRGF
jgi:phage gp36-like protein